MPMPARRHTAKTKKADEYWIQTDHAGFITAIDPDCVSLLNLSPRGAHQRQLVVFFTEERPVVVGRMDMVSRGIGSEAIAGISFRPLERRPILVDVQIARVNDTTLEWVMAPKG